MKTENEIIAEFMGAERREGPRAFNPSQTLVQWVIKGNPYNQHRDDVKHWYQPVELKYHESFDWLMPVVEKIKVICVNHPELPDSEFNKVLDSKITTSIEILHERIVEFIKFYNEETKAERG